MINPPPPLLVLATLVLPLLAGCAPTVSWKPDYVSAKDVPVETPVESDLPDAVGLKQLAIGQRISSYRIGPNDELIVSVWGRPDLGSQIPSERDNRRNISIVQQDGTISLPFLDNVKVAGMTAREAAQLIRVAYGDIVDQPLVDVSVVRFQSQQITLEGAIANPGNVFLTSTVQTLSEAVTAAGGLTPTADTTRGLLVRGNSSFSINYRAGKEGKSNIQNLLLHAGDRIYFPEISERVVYVFGEVQKPGAKPIPPSGLTLLEAIAAAGGLNVLSADYGKLYLLRENNAKTTIFQLSLDEVMRAPEISLLAQDRIFVPPTKLALWDRTWRQLLPFANTGQQVVRTLSVD